MPPPLPHVRKNAYFVLIGAKVSALMLACTVSTYAQQTPAQSDEEIVRLSPFSVNESANVGRYQAVEASSGSRVRMNLMESSQSISVLTNEFLGDIDTTQLLDAVKYVAGITISTNSNILDMMNIRGFRTDGTATIDGFIQAIFVNQDPVTIERIEVVKGPNAILAPQGSPGGVVNSVTKRPLFKNSGSISYQVGRYDANRTEVDANYVVKEDKLALRVVGAYTDADAYLKEVFRQNLTVMPMLTYRFSQTAELTAQVQAYNATSMAGDSPLSPYSVGWNARLLEGIPRNFGMTGRNVTQHESGQRMQLFFTGQITDKLSMRLAAKWAERSTRAGFMRIGNPFDANGNPAAVVKLNPITGEWEWDGVTRNDDPYYTLPGEVTWITSDFANLQNDFVFEHNAQGWKSQTVAGYTINYSSELNRSKRHILSGPFDFKDPNYTPPPYTLNSNWSNHNVLRTRNTQVYLHQVFNLFDDRLVLSGSLSQNRYFSDNKNNLNATYSPERAEATLLSGGVVYKVTPGVSLYYGYSEQEILGQSEPFLLIPSHTRPSRQHEGGLRLKLFDGKLYATFAYFDILQDNIWSGSTVNYLDPNGPRIPPLRSSRTAKGFEFEFAWSPTKNLSVIGSFTDFENRDKDNMLYANSAERMAGIWGSYSFSETGPLRGLSIGLGANYVGERAGSTQGNYTEPPLGFAPVRVQPVFWFPSYTVVEANVSYRFNKHWKAQLVIKNLLDRDYIIGAFNHNAILSTPINPKLSLRYEF